MWLIEAVISALLGLIVLAGMPFVFYWAYQKWRHKRRLGEVLKRTGVQLGDVRYLGISLGVSMLIVLILILWPPPLEPMVREGSSSHKFAGLGFSGQAIVMAILYGVVATGFSEEFLFRGMIAGSLSRCLSIGWANLLQSLIFLAPHLLLLLISPEIWWILPIIFAGSMLNGWIRIKSDSILGPWLIHAAANVAMSLSVAIRT